MSDVSKPSRRAAASGRVVDFAGAPKPAEATRSHAATCSCPRAARIAIMGVLVPPIPNWCIGAHARRC
jgi:hypothetical protein